MDQNEKVVPELTDEQYLGGDRRPPKKGAGLVGGAYDGSQGIETQ